MKQTYIKPAMEVIAVAPSEPVMLLSEIHSDVNDETPNMIGGKTTSSEHPLATRRRGLWEYDD